MYIHVYTSMYVCGSSWCRNFLFLFCKNVHSKVYQKMYDVIISLLLKRFVNRQHTHASLLHVDKRKEIKKKLNFIDNLINYTKCWTRKNIFRSLSFIFHVINKIELCVRGCTTVVNNDGIFSLSIDSQAKFLDVIGTKVGRVFLLAIHSHLITNFTSPWAKVVCNVWELSRLSTETSMKLYVHESSSEMVTQEYIIYKQGGCFCGMKKKMLKKNTGFPLSFEVAPPSNLVPMCALFIYMYICTGAKFMNVHFLWGFWASSWEFSDLRFLCTMITLQTSFNPLLLKGGGGSKAR